MATKILLLYKNLLLNSTLTASSAATGFPVSNLKNPFRSKAWRTAGATAGTANLVINLGSALAVNCVALTGYTWASAPGTLNLEFNATDDWGAPSATEALTWKAATTPYGNKGSIIKAFASKTYQYLRLNVVYSPGATPTDWDLGVIHVGTYFQPAVNVSHGFEYSIIDPSMESVTVGGQLHHDQLDKYRRFDFSQRIFTATEFKNFQNFYNEVGTVKPIFVSYDYDNAEETTIYGNLTDAMAVQNKVLNYYETEFELRESR